MLQLTPGEQFPIVRQLNDPSDTGTYFIQAVIKRSIDEVTIATVNLTDQGGQRFKTNWQVTSDNGLGVFITITTTVYTDSGYTTKSDLYGIQSIEYLIQERLNRSLMNTFGGSGVNYDMIRKIVRQEIEKMPEFPEVKMPKFDYSIIIAELKDISKQIKSIVIPSQKDFDLSEIMTKFGKLSEIIKSIPLPKEVDFEPLSKKIESLASGISEKVGDINVKTEKTNELLEKVEELVDRLYALKFNINLKSENGKEEPPAPKFRLPRKVYK